MKLLSTHNKDRFHKRNRAEDRAELNRQVRKEDKKLNQLYPNCTILQGKARTINRGNFGKRKPRRKLRTFRGHLIRTVLEKTGSRRNGKLVVVGTARCFSETGDSGSFVISQLLKELIGIAWGSLNTREAAFVTPIESVKQDVLEITGHKARLLEE